MGGYVEFLRSLLPKQVKVDDGRSFHLFVIRCARGFTYDWFCNICISPELVTLLLLFLNYLQWRKICTFTIFARTLLEVRVKARGHGY